MNQVILTGNLGKKPELKYTKNGKPVANLSVATSKKVKDDWVSSWHNVVVWGKQAEAVARLADKGSKVFVVGELQTRSWEKDGQKRYVTEVISFNCQLLNSDKNGSPEPTDSDATASEPEHGYLSEDDVSF